MFFHHLSMYKSSFRFVLLIGLLALTHLTIVHAKSNDETAVKKNIQSEKNKLNKSYKSNKDKTSKDIKVVGEDDRSKKRIKSPKNSREVRTTVMPRNRMAEPVPPRMSKGKALGLSKKPDELNLKSNASIVVDQQNQRVIFDKNSQIVLPIASITKLLTAMTVLDAKLPMDEELEINDEDASIYNHSRLIKGTVLTRREALLLALMSSENRAAYTLGRNYPGGITAFMAALNNKAKEIGMKHSSFSDPTGLTSKNVATAEDLAIMIQAAYQYPLIKQFTTTPSHVKEIHHREQTFLNSNRLVRSGDMEILIQKTGYISEAGRCLVLMANINNKVFTMVFLDSMGSQSRFADAVRVKEWVESSDEYPTLRQLTPLKPVLN